MSYYWGDKSLEKINTCDPRIIKIFLTAITTAPFDATVIWGYRGEKIQNAMCDSYPPTSQARYPKSKHNTVPSLAIDIAPYNATKPHINWQDNEKFRILACHIKVVAYKLNIPIIWGPDLGGWMERDLGHYQIGK